MRLPRRIRWETARRFSPRSGGFLMIVICSIASPDFAGADPVLSTDPAPASYAIEARVRNGNTGFEAVLFTPADPSPGSAATQLNPVGAPVWAYGTSYDFKFTYSYATGTATWAIDFNRDSDFLDSEELATSTTSALAGKGFEYVNLLAQGTTSATASLFDPKINGTNVGSFASTNDGAATNKLFEETSGLFTDITVTSSFTFSGSGGQERPRIWVQLGNPLDVAAVPEPATILSAFMAMAAPLGLRAYRRRFRATTSV